MDVHPVICTASGRGQVRLVRALLNAGASIHEMDAEEQTAIDFAQTFEHRAVINFIEQELAKTTEVVPNQDTITSDERTRRNEEHRRRIEERDAKSQRDAEQKAREDRAERHRISQARKQAKCAWLEDTARPTTGRCANMSAIVRCPGSSRASCSKRRFNKDTTKSLHV